MKKYTLSSIVAASIVGVTMFTGCGSSSSTPVDTTSTVSGQALAAYISGGNAFIDCNKNGIQDSGELNATTKADGNYTITGQVCSDYNIVVINGKNSETGVAIKYPTVAPKGFTKVSPVTTMLASLSEDNRTALLADLNITTDDLNKDYNIGSSDTTIQAKIAKVAAIKSYVETALTSSSTIAQVTTVATALKAAVATAKASTSASAVDFTSPTVLANLNTALVTNLLSSNDFNTTELNTSLTAQVTNITTIAAATSSTALTEALNVVENANAATVVSSDDTISKVGLTTVKLGTSTENEKAITIVNNASFDANVTAGTSIEAFFPVTISGLTVSKTFDDQNVSISVEIKNTAGDMVSLSVNGVTLRGNENNTSTVVIPVETEAVLTSSASLSNLVAAMGSTRLTTTTATEKSYTNSASLEFTDIINRITSARRTAILTALQNYFLQIGTYTVTIKVTGQDTSVFIPTVVGKISVQSAK